MRQFRVPTWGVVSLFYVPAAFSAFVIYEVVSTAMGSPDEVVRTPYSPGILILILLVLWWRALTTVFAVTIRSDDTVELRSAVRRIVLRPHEVTAIDLPARSWNIALRYRGGKIGITGSLAGLSDFLAWLRERNPSLSPAAPGSGRSSTPAQPTPAAAAPPAAVSGINVLRAVVGVALVVAGVVAGLVLAFLTGLIFLPESGVAAALLYAAILGELAGGFGGHVAALGGKMGAVVGALGAAVSLALFGSGINPTGTATYNPAPWAEALS